jgi:predicted enzyme related to lactoylglutathione lyase
MPVTTTLLMKLKPEVSMKGLSLLGLLMMLGLPLAAQEKAEKQKVLGIGGLFFRSKNPAELARWYETNLGIAHTPTSYDAEPWRQEAGVTIFAPFSDSTNYFGSRDRMWMVNFRVKSLDLMVRQLQASGISVKVDPETYPNGRFARLYDPEGNPIELWEPKDPR